MGYMQIHLGMFLIYIEYTVTNFLMRHQYGLSPISYSTEELHISHLTSATTMGVIPWIIFVDIGLRLCVVIKNTFSWKDTSTPPHHVHCSIIYNSPEQPVSAHGWVDKENVLHRVCVCVCVRAYMLSCFSCVRLCDPMDCSLPGSSVHEISQARILEWVAMPSSRGSSPPRNQTWVSFVAGGLFTAEPSGQRARARVCVCVCVCVTYMPIIQPW